MTNMLISNQITTTATTMTRTTATLYTLPSSKVLYVQRKNPVLVTPAEPTPHEFKPLSDVDDQESLRFHVHFIQYYKNAPEMEGCDPVEVIREALAKALVFYYPFAGRLTEGKKRKLIVECTGEGVLFVEADANVKLEDFGEQLPPPLPWIKDLLVDVPGSDGIIGGPLLLIQILRKGPGRTATKKDKQNLCNFRNQKKSIMNCLLLDEDILKALHIASLPPRLEGYSNKGFIDIKLPLIFSPK